MRKVSIYEYYRFGFEYSNLLDIDNELTNGELFDSLMDYSSFINNQDLKVTLSANKQKHLFYLIDQMKDLDRDLYVDPDLQSKIVEILDKTDTVLDAEIVDKFAFIPEDKRYSTDKLTENIMSLFEENVFSKLPDHITFDIRETGMCLSFDRYTASAFHILRAMENSFRFFAETKLLLQVPSDENWFSILKRSEEVMKTKNLKSYEDMVANLHLLRMYYRNETAHLGRQYSSSEAQDLFNTCIKVINQMFSE